MENVIKKVLLREFGEKIINYDDWLTFIYQWTDRPSFEYGGSDISVYDGGGIYLGYWDDDKNFGFVITNYVD